MLSRKDVGLPHKVQQASPTPESSPRDDAGKAHSCGNEGLLKTFNSINVLAGF